VAERHDRREKTMHLDEGSWPKVELAPEQLVGLWQVLCQYIPDTHPLRCPLVAFRRLGIAFDPDAV